MTNKPNDYICIDMDLEKETEDRQRIDSELQKGLDSLNEGSYTVDDVDKMLTDRYGIY